MWTPFCLQYKENGGSNYILVTQDGLSLEEGPGTQGTNALNIIPSYLS